METNTEEFTLGLQLAASQATRNELQKKISNDDIDSAKEQRRMQGEIDELMIRLKMLEDERTKIKEVDIVENESLCAKEAAMKCKLENEADLPVKKKSTFISKIKGFFKLKKNNLPKTKSIPNQQTNDRLKLSKKSSKPSISDRIRSIVVSHTIILIIAEQCKERVTKRAMLISFELINRFSFQIIVHQMHLMQYNQYTSSHLDMYPLSPIRITDHGMIELQYATTEAVFKLSILRALEFIYHSEWSTISSFKRLTFVLSNYVNGHQEDPLYVGATVLSDLLVHPSLSKLLNDAFHRIFK